MDLILRSALENPTWGFDRIQGPLGNVGYRISDTTVGNVLKQHGIRPAPDRKRQTTWATFLKAHWDVLASIDFTTVELWTKGGLVTYYLLLVMHVASRRVHFAGCTTNPHTAWMKQAARELTNFEERFLNEKRYLIMDRDSKFCRSFRAMLDDEGVKCVQLPPRSPNLHPHLERFFGSLKAETLDRIIFFGEKMLRQASHSYLDHYHHERNHHGLGNRIPEPDRENGRAHGQIECREHFGGLLKYYRRLAA